MKRVTDALRRAAEEGAEIETGVITPPERQNGERRYGDDPSELQNGKSGPGDGFGAGDLTHTHGVTGESSNGYRSLNGGLKPIARSTGGWISKLFLGSRLCNVEPFPIVAREGNSPAAERYKMLREQLKKICNEKKIRVLAVTSPIKGDGKTTVAANLAATMALDYEQKVLLIDADLRSPSIHNYYQMSSAPGLADYLNTDCSTDLGDYVKDSIVEGLRILPAGNPAALPSELLAKESMKNAMDNIALKFPRHRIIIDTPPILSTPDPLVLARHVDGIVIVVRAKNTPRDCLTKAISSLGSDKIVGVILNGADRELSSKYYYGYKRNGV